MVTDDVVPNVTGQTALHLVAIAVVVAAVVAVLKTPPPHCDKETKSMAATPATATTARCHQNYYALPTAARHCCSWEHIRTHGPMRCI